MSVLNVENVKKKLFDKCAYVTHLAICVTNLFFKKIVSFSMSEFQYMSATDLFPVFFDYDVVRKGECEL